VPDTIVSLVPAQPGWRALYRGEFDEEPESARVVAWALIESAGGDREVVGLVIDPGDATRIVPAPEGASEFAPQFERYGFKAG
jgi:hypothetical protein